MKRTIEIVFKYLDKHRFQARMVVGALCIGFILVAIGVMINLAKSSSIFNF